MYFGFFSEINVNNVGFLPIQFCPKCINITFNIQQFFYEMLPEDPRTTSVKILSIVVLILLQGSTIRIRSVRTYAWVTGTYTWLISCVRSHVRTFPFRLDYKTSKSDLIKHSKATLPSLQLKIQCIDCI